ncbi:MAG: retention module-containing protein, partial [Sulfuricella sp.]|nr:retention module-containing protein [Sulfuricella sp.]
MAQQGNIVGKVIVLQGQAFARSEDGHQHQLKLGDAVYEGEVIVTGPGGKVELSFDEGRSYVVREKETVTLDSMVIGSELPEGKDAALLGRVSELSDVTRAIAEGSSLDQLLDETAAGLGGGGFSNDGHSFVQLLRVVEGLAPAEYQYEFGEGVQAYDLLVGAGLDGPVPAVDTTPTEAPTVTIDADANNDGYINNAELGAAATLAVTVSLPATAKAGDTVTLTDGIVSQTHVLTAADIAASNWSTEVAKPADGAALTVAATVTDGAGNVSLPGSDAAVIDTTAGATITVDAITADNVINAAEAGATVAVTGIVGGDAAPGDTVSFTINGTAYSGLVAADNTYSIAVAGSDLAADTSFDATVSGSDAAGNPFSATTTSTHTVDAGPDTTIVALAATPAVAEGGTITYTATLSNPAETAMTVTLSNGAVISIAAGA